MRTYKASRPTESLPAERSLLAAIILLAVKDAQNGDEDAADWLQTAGADWGFVFLHIPSECFCRDWTQTRLRFNRSFNADHDHNYENYVPRPSHRRKGTPKKSGSKPVR